MQKPSKMKLQKINYDNNNSIKLTKRRKAKYIMFIYNKLSYHIKIISIQDIIKLDFYDEAMCCQVLS